MEFKDFFDMVKGVDEYNVYRPNDFDAFYPPHFPDKYHGSQIDEVFMQSTNDDWVIAVVYLK
jgi:hypothetical protein